MRLVLLIIANLIAMVLVMAYLLPFFGERPLTDDARPAAPGQFIETSQGKLHYRWHGPGEGPVIVMAHGFSTPNFIFGPNIAPLTEAGYRALTYDHWGRGWSDRPGGEYNDARYERELLDLLDGLGVTEPVGLVGLSMGGLTSTYFTVLNPDRVAGLFLLVPAGFDVAPQADTGIHKMNMTPVVGDWIWRVFGRATILRDPDYGPPGDIFEQANYPGYFRALLSSYRNMRMFDRDPLFEKLATTDVPVAAVFGDADETVLPASFDRFRAAVPDAYRAILVPGGEHGLSFQMPDAVNPILKDFFVTHLPIESGL